MSTRTQHITSPATSRSLGQRSWPARSRSRTSAAVTGENDRLKTELAGARAALKTAEARERARVADDLHDILGHALEVVAFKAELADRVLRGDTGRARGELIEIQRVARSAMNDVRSLARCRRPTNLDDELAGAVSLFDSAGVDVKVTGDVTLIARCARDPLARALREAVTNVLRHAAPTLFHITFEQDSIGASIAIVNDGVETNPATPQAGGTGLVGLSRLLAEHGGRLCAGQNGSGFFTLRATIATPVAAVSELAPAQAPRAESPGARRPAVQR